MTGAGTIIVIIGPTASGKSELALRTAEAMGGEILAVDSMTVYRGMDVGTAKPTAHERARVRHHLLDVVEPSETFTVARFVEMAEQMIADAAARRVPLVATGGTPLYYKALFDGLFEGPGADPAVRAKLVELGNEGMHRRLSEVDPVAARRIHSNDTKRLVRALEVHELTGRPISECQREWEQPGRPRRFDATWFGLRWEKEALNRRINARVKSMVESGWVDETRALLARHGTLSKTAAEATGYREMIEHVQGRLPLDEAAERIKIGTRQLAQRQMKWFRRFPDVRWLAGEEGVEVALRAVLGRVGDGAGGAGR